MHVLYPQTCTDAHKSQSTHENLLFRMHVSNAHKPGIRVPEIPKHGVMKTGGVTADKAAAALSAPGT